MTFGWGGGGRVGSVCPKIGIGGVVTHSPLPTTVHAGPHTAVRRIKLGPYDQGRKPELGKVGSGQGTGHSGRVREPPGTVRTPGGLCRQVLSDAPFAREKRLQAKLKRQAKKLGYELVPIEPKAA